MMQFFFERFASIQSQQAKNAASLPIRRSGKASLGRQSGARRTILSDSRDQHKEKGEGTTHHVSLFRPRCIDRPTDSALTSVLALAAESKGIPVPQKKSSRSAPTGDQPPVCAKTMTSRG